MSTTTTRERPLILSGPMVRAVLEGRKSQTRRVVKPQPPHRANVEPTREGFCFCLGEHHRSESCDWRPVRCPYGVPGDRLWVRETFRHFGNGQDGHNPIRAHVTYKADGVTLDCGSWASFDEAPEQRWWNTWQQPAPWSSPRFMPRWASRITLRIEDIRVERLQAISEEDAVAEGCSGVRHVPEVGGWLDPPSFEFRRRWDDLNAKRGFPWESNCWVWALTLSVASIAGKDS